MQQNSVEISEAERADGLTDDPHASLSHAIGFIVRQIGITKSAPITDWVLSDEEHPLTAALNILLAARKEVEKAAGNKAILTRF